MHEPLLPIPDPVWDNFSYGFSVVGTSMPPLSLLALAHIPDQCTKHHNTLRSLAAPSLIGRWAQAACLHVCSCRRAARAAWVHRSRRDRDDGQQIRPGFSPAGRNNFDWGLVQGDYLGGVWFLGTNV
jgi:hypothetical protein